MKKVCCFIIFLSIFSIIACRDKERWDDNKKDWSELMLAIYYRNNKKTKNLINNNVDIMYNAGGHFNLTAMSVAIYRENEVAVYELLNSGKMGNIDRYLNLACGIRDFNNIQIIKYLYEFGADVNIINDNDKQKLLELLK
jgi:ankyrin repeat protein